jgi:hypothetical protein
MGIAVTQANSKPTVRLTTIGTPTIQLNAKTCVAVMHWNIAIRTKT